MNHDPYAIAEEKLAISAEYEHLSERLALIDMERPSIWMTLKKDSKSDKEADMKWSMTNLGQEEIKIRARLKSIDKRTSAISSMLRILETEYRNTR